jgi:hypothetical protein
MREQIPMSNQSARIIGYSVLIYGNAADIRLLTGETRTWRRVGLSSSKMGRGWRNYNEGWLRQFWRVNLVDGLSLNQVEHPAIPPVCLPESPIGRPDCSVSREESVFHPAKGSSVQYIPRHI